MLEHRNIVVERIEELQEEMRKGSPKGSLVFATITHLGITVTVVGPVGRVSRHYSLLMVESANLNVLTFELDAMRTEVGL